MSNPTLSPMSAWLIEPMEKRVADVVERIRRTDDVQRVAVMPDVHLANEVCVGMVIATSRLIFPGAVGGDIGCGMLALAFDVEADALNDPVRAAKVLKRLYAAVPTIRRHRTRVAEYPPALSRATLSHGSLEAIKRTEGTLQLGTLGGGNHFVEIQSDDDGRLWLMVHSGSRCMGQAIRGFHQARCRRLRGGMLALDAGNPEGEAYLHDATWACQYADANRRAIADAVRAILNEELGAMPVERSIITCDHNHVRLEAHAGGQCWVHRKGAMPASEGSAGVLPGSMGTLSFHVEGRGCDESLRSSAHGAGRALSRDAARRAFRARDVQRQMQGVWFDPRLSDALRDEAPQAYKDVRAVLRAQQELVKVTRTLRPVMTFKSG